MIRNALYRSFRTGAALVAAIVTFTTMTGAQVTPAVRTITAAINNGDRVALNKSVRRSVAQATDLGPANTSLTAHHVTLVLQRSPERQAALEQYLSDVQNSESGSYRHWLTPAEYGARFGASPDDVQAIVAWLQSQGLTIEKASPAANMITISGTVGQMQTAFSTSIHSLSVNGERHIANVSEAQVPRALAPAVKSVLGLDDFHPHSNAQQGPKAKFNSVTHHIDPDFTLFDSAGNPYLYVNPADAATIYDTPNANLNTRYKGTTYDGTGVTVGIVGDSNVDMAPVTNYRVAFLGETSANANLPTVIIDGSDPGINGDELETWLDMEVLGGLAPKAKLNYYTSADSDLSAGLFNAIERAINDNAVSVLSISFGECESNAGSGTTDFIGEIFQQAAAQGITVTVSTGDSGAAGCDASSAPTAAHGLGVNALGSSVNNVAVGGTDYDVLSNAFSTYVTTQANGQQTSGLAPYYGTALSYIPERPWNDSTTVNGALAANVPLVLASSGTTNIIAGGGGKSLQTPKPPFQSGLTPADGARDVPDVSFLAANGLYGAVWVLCETQISGADCATTKGQFTSSSTFSGAGGTSAATPAFAGMLALVVQAQGTRLGNVNNIIYKLAASKYSTVFHDVTAGNIAVVCTSGSPNCGSNGFTTGFDAGTGYDLASGLGSVDAAAMLANWASAAPASSSATLAINGSASPVSVTHGASLNFTVGVNPSTATGAAGLVTTAKAAAGAPTLNGQPFSIAISGGTGTGSYNGLPGGSYTVFASYSGDVNNAASQTNAISVNIAPENSSTQLSVNAYNASQVPISNLNALPYGSYIFGETSVYGTAEGFNASLGYATGTMTMQDNGANIGTAPITSGNFASFPTVAGGVYPFAVGAHTITATYPGDASYKANTSNSVNITVVKGATTPLFFPTTTTLGSTASDKIVVDITTSSLAKPPTGTVTLTANGTTLGTITNLSGGNSLSDGTAVAEAIFTVQGSQLVNGKNTITATYSGDSNYSGSTANTSLTVNASSFSLTTTPISISAGTSGTATVTANSTGTFAGVVNLTCAIASAPANATSPVTCSVPSTILLTGTTSATSVLAVNSTATTTAGAYMVTVTGIDAATGKITATTISAVTVTGTPGIALSNSAAISIHAGATSGNTSTLTVTPSNGYTGTVSFTCATSSAPAGAVNPVTCSISPTSVTLTGAAAGTATLSIASTARTTSSLDLPHPLLRGVGGTLFAFCVFLAWPSRRRRVASLFAVIALLALGAAVGCGGGGSTGGGGGTSPAPTGTTAGTYAVTVTATPTGGSPQSVSVSVTVN